MPNRAQLGLPRLLRGSAAPAKCAQRRRAAITLIEILVTAVVLGIGFVGVASMVTYATIAHKKSVNITVATARTMQEIERVRQAGYLNAQVSQELFPPPTYTILNATQVGFALSELKDGSGVITLVEDVEAQALQNMKQVQVEITWGGAPILRGSYTASTLITNRP